MNKESIQTIDLCSSAPELPFPMVERPHIVQTITHIFDSKAEVVIIEGDIGCGKTVILKEFWDKADSPCFGIFLGNTDRLFFQSIYARMEFSCQLYGYINERIPPNNIDLTEGELRTLWQKCARKLNRKRQLGYVIIDGIYHIPGKQNSIKQAILDLLPLGVKPFKFIFSNRVDGPSIVESSKHSTKIFVLSNFALHETNSYLNDVVKDKNTRNEYHYTTGGLPSKLASIRRQIEANFSEKLILSSEVDIESLFEAEWGQIQPLSQETSTVLSILLAFGGAADSSTVATNCSIDQEEIERIFSSLQFLKLNTKSLNWEFSNDSFRRFAEKKLQNAVYSATESIARNLLDNPASHHSILSLPRYLDQIKSVEHLRQLLDAKRVASILLEHKSATVIEPTLKQAVETCLSSRHISALTVFSIIRSTIQQILRSSGNVHEIQARCALGDYDGALTLANDAPLHAQRLRSLSKLASSLAENSSYPTQQLIHEIEALCKQIDFSDLHPDKAIQIAAELYPITPKLSLSILKDLSQDESENSNFELAIARITLETIIHKEMGLSMERDSQVPLTEKPKIDKELRELIETYTEFAFVKSANEVLEAIQEISGISERLFVQRKWISQNPNRADALDVIENAINEAISTIEYAPNATFYREIATPLPGITDLNRRKKIISVLDGQNQVIQRKGPTVDYVRLQLTLFRCNCSENDLLSATNRLEKLCLEDLDRINECETRITCLAWISSELVGIEQIQSSFELQELVDFVDKEFEETKDYILDNCADQFEILSSALGALAKKKPRVASEIAMQLNIVERRNEANLHLIESICSGDSTGLDSEILFDILTNIESHIDKDSAILEITEYLCDEVERNKERCLGLENLLIYLKDISSPSVKTKCLALLANSIALVPNSEELLKSVQEEILNVFQTITSPLIKYQLGCNLVANLRSNCPDLAKKIYNHLTISENTLSKSRDMVEAYYLLADLMCKTAWALAKSNLLQESEFQRVCEIIDKMPEPQTQIELFSTLAFFLWRENQSQFVSKIVHHHIVAKLNHFSEHENSVLYKAWSIAYPTVWLVDRDLARKKTEQFPSDVKDICITNLVFAILRKQPPGEPFDDETYNAKVLFDYADIRNLLTLCQEINDDFVIFRVFASIATAFSEKISRVKFTHDQKAEVIRSMLEISEDRFPMKNKIQHAGYQILCKAQILRIGDQDKFNWDVLTNESKRLTNDADRIFVIAHIASYLPRKQIKNSEALFKFAENLTDELKSIEDQFGRYYLIASLISKKNKGWASSIIKKSFKKFSRQTKGHQNVAMEKELVDLAYKIESDLPLQLAPLYDDDPARESYNRRAEKQIKSHKLRKKIGDSKNGIELTELATQSHLEKIAWQAIGSLNSGHTLPVEISRARDMLACASNFPLSTAYPMYSWVIANITLKYSETPNANEYLSELFKGILDGLEFLSLMVDKNEFYSSNPVWGEFGESKSNLIVHQGERDNALLYIRNWLEKHAEDVITIMDPYFNNSSLEILRPIVEIDPALKVRVITGKKNQPKADISLPKLYSDSWREICNHSPPDTEILIVGSANTDSVPFHDRWILTDSIALRLGTSISSLGNKDSEISIVRSDELHHVKSTVRKYYNKEVKEFHGHRISYESFDLLP